MEVALAVTMMCIAAASAFGLRALTNAELGFTPDGVFLARFSELAEPRFTGVFNRERLLEEIRSSVISTGLGTEAAWSSITPFGNYPSTKFSLGRSGMVRDARFGPISASYFRLLGIPLDSGRPFDAGDTRMTRPVAIVNEAFAREFVSHPIGHTILLRDGPHPASWDLVTIVAVVGDVRARYGAVAPPAIYVPTSQHPLGTEVLLVQSTRSSTDLTNSLQGAAAKIADIKSQPAVISLRDLMRLTVAARESLASLLTAIAACALIIAVIGVYAVVSYDTERRTHEFGVRRALGASRENIFGLVSLTALTLVSLGTFAGLWIAVAVDMALPADLLPIQAPAAVYVVAGLFFLLVSFGATALPAMRAANMSPIDALRYE